MKRTLSLLLTLSMLLSVLVMAFTVPTGAVADPMSEHLLVNFDFENSANPYKDASGKYTLGFTNGTGGVYENGVLKTSGDNKLYMSLNDAFLSGVTDQLTIVLKMKMDTVNNFFLRWCDAGGAQLYRAKLEATGMTTSVDPATGSAIWNKKTDVVTSAGTWYYVAISLADSDAGLVETLNVMAENGDTVMSGTHTWAGSKMTVAALAAANQWIQIGRYDVTYLDDFRVYKSVFTAEDAKGVFAAMAAPDAPVVPEIPDEDIEIPDALVKFDFEDAENPLKDATGAYLFGFFGNGGTSEGGMLKTVGDGDNFMSLNADFMKGVTTEMTIVMKMKMETMSNFFLRWCDGTTGAQQYLAKLAATGMNTNLGVWNERGSVLAATNAWYYVAISLADTESGVVETLNVMAVDGGTLMTDTYTWTDTTFRVSSVSAGKQWLQIGRYDVTYLDDFRLYGKAFSAAEAKSLFNKFDAVPEEEPEAPIVIPDALVTFDFEDSKMPLADSTGLYSFSFNSTGGTVENGAMKTAGDETNFMSLNAAFMKDVTTEMTIVMKMKMETMNNFFLRWCDGTTGTQQYLAKLEETGMNTYLNAWNKKAAIVASANTWYFVAISLADTESGVVETLSVMPAEGGEVMTGSYTWTDSTFRVSSVAAGKQWLQIGRYDVTYLDELRLYGKAFSSQEAKVAFSDMMPMADCFLNFNFENAAAPGQDATGIYTMHTVGNAVIGSGAAVSNGIESGTTHLNVVDDEATTLFDTVTNTLTVVQRFRVDSFGKVQYSIYDTTDNRWVHRMQFNPNTGAMQTSVGLKWNAYPDVKATVGEWYNYAVTLTQTASGIKETVYLCAADGTEIMSGEFVWNLANLQVATPNLTAEQAALPDLTVLKDHTSIMHFGRYQCLTLDDLRLYNYAFTNKMFAQVCAELNGVAIDPFLDYDFSVNGSYDVTDTYFVNKYGSAKVENGIAVSVGASDGSADRFEFWGGNYLGAVSDQMTASVMFRIDSMPDGDRQFFRIYNSATLKDIIAIYAKADGTIYSRYGGGVADTQITEKTVVPGEWYIVTFSLTELNGVIAHTLSLTSFENAETVSVSNGFANGGVTINFAEGKPLTHLGRFFPISFSRIAFYDTDLEDHALVADQVSKHYLFTQYDFEGVDLGTQLADKAPIGAVNGSASVEGDRVFENGVITLDATAVNGLHRINIDTKDYKELVRSDVTVFMTLRANDLSKGDIFFRLWDSTNNYHAVSLKLLADGGLSYISDASTKAWGNTTGITLTEGTFYNLAVTLEKLSSNGAYATYRQTVYASPATVSGPAYMMTDVAEVVLCDLDMAEKNMLTQLGRYGDCSFADFRMYASALSAQSIREVFAENTIALDKTAPEFVGIQTSTGFDEQNGDTFGIRFIASIDNLAYSSLGFKIQALYEGGSKAEKYMKSEYVYTTLNGMDGKKTMQYKASDFDAAYLMALSITGIPVSTGTVTFRVTPYAIREYGDPLGYLMATKTVYGATYEVTYNGTTGKLDYKTVGATATEFVERKNVGTGLDEGGMITLNKGVSTFALTYTSQDASASALLNAIANKMDDVYTAGGISTSVKTGSFELAENETVVEFVLLSDGYKHRGSLNDSCHASGHYAVTLENDNRIVVAGYSVIDLLNAAYALADMIGEGSAVTLYQSDYFYSNRSNNKATPDKAAAAALYRELFGTYSSYAEWAESEMLSTADKNDQKLIEAMIERMNDAFAVYPGSSSVLYKGRIEKLDTKDYSKLTYVDGSGNLWIASEFAKKYFVGASFAETNGMMNLTLFCSQNTGYTLYYNATYGVAVVSSPTMSIPFSAATLSTAVNGYTDGQYMMRMQKFFTSAFMPEPSSNAEQTRVEISAFPFDPSEIYDYTTQSYKTHYSPSICKVGNVIYVSYEDCYVTNFATETGNRTILVRSTDGGKTWEELGVANGMRWATVFELNGKLYVMGVGVDTGKAMLAEYNPATGVYRYDSLDMYGGAGAPCAVIVANGRIYKSSFSSVISAPVDADLFDYTSWTISERAEKYASVEWFRAQTGYEGELTYGAALGEGNLVLGKDGTVYLMLRVDSQPCYGYAVLIKCSKDGKTLSEPQLIRFPADADKPASVSKFTVRYDEASGKYFALVSIVTVDQNDAHAAAQRNVLALIASDDLVNWSYVDTVLVDRDMINPSLSRYVHAFQYVDFVIDGNDILMVVREASGVTNTYHDGKYVTYYVIENFRDLLN